MKNEKVHLVIPGHFLYYFWLPELDLCLKYLRNGNQCEDKEQFNGYLHNVCSDMPILIFRRCTLKMSLLGALALWGVGLTLSTMSLWSGLLLQWIWTCPLLHIWMPVKVQNRIANSVDPDETAHDEPSHQDLHFLQRHMLWSVGLKTLLHFQVRLFLSPPKRDLLYKQSKLFRRR